jgi:thiamine-phosphate pyrophosphorylase
MKILVITSPDFIADEAAQIVQLLEKNVTFVHIRKPNATQDELHDLLTKIPTRYHHRLALHDHFELVKQFSQIGGLHLNARNSVLPNDWSGRVSQSCHSLNELKRCKSSVDYCFLSPIFDSISKTNYKSAFSLEQLQRSPMIDEKVFALGGVRFSHQNVLKQCGFGGMVLMGEIWSKT